MRRGERLKTEISQPQRALLMTVTVVIPAFNEEGDVGRLIHETFRVAPREILSAMIVVDDGGSDHTGDEIKSLISIYPRLRHIRHSVRTPG
jgi:dolichol-phosphate mannosyltransferase